MNRILSRTAAAAGVAAWLMSTTLQVYRSTRGTGLAVDSLAPGAAVALLALIAMSLALLTDRRWAWWTNLAVAAAFFLQAPFLYWPLVYDARPLEVWDWLEGTWFTALLLLVCACAVLRLATWSRRWVPVDATGRDARPDRPDRPDRVALAGRA
ncbi:hypothetical protein [Aquipuribacter sp. SD81]|uniref:hypothetical protein n=1 Tax=Aquipuribacter sp. SD81 TaxID=3127703 RepID=UPI0030195D12